MLIEYCRQKHARQGFLFRCHSKKPTKYFVGIRKNISVFIYFCLDCYDRKANNSSQLSHVNV